MAPPTSKERRDTKRIPLYDGTTGLEGYLTERWLDGEKLLALHEKLKGQAARILENIDLSITAAGGLVTLQQLLAGLQQSLIGDRTEWVGTAEGHS